MNDDRQRPARELKHMTRRELLKLTPVLVFGALTLPPFSEGLLKTGLGWTDRAARAFFSPERQAQTFSNHELTPIEQFPINSYSDYNPVPGHLLMVALHGWSNFYSMLTGWKRDPDYLAN